MGLDTRTATRLADARLAEWRRAGYDEWRELLDDREVRHTVADDGNRYTVVSHTLDDGDGRLRMTVAVDDGGWSVFAPLVRDDIMNADGTFVASLRQPLRSTPFQ
ncbi:hypothetical protein ACFOOK_13905 [Micromonospora krabiensis]|uniref:Uncharacterized protein n=1 Tax=Micromonospora krabiensis TaxID=307121 RepID=A0A1C3N1P8_9ACTN|nr:hypothetical protein GA0070620_1960 [Micromonospora krabiensis]